MCRVTTWIWFSFFTISFSQEKENCHNRYAQGHCIFIFYYFIWSGARELQGHQQLSGKSEKNKSFKSNHLAPSIYIMIELCFFSLDQWEIRIHLLWGKCFNIPHHCDPHLNQTKFNDLFPLTIAGVLALLMVLKVGSTTWHNHFLSLMSQERRQEYERNTRKEQVNSPAIILAFFFLRIIGILFGEYNTSFCLLSCLFLIYFFHLEIFSVSLISRKRQWHQMIPTLSTLHVLLCPSLWFVIHLRG